MEATYEFGVSDRMRAVLSVKHPKKPIHGTERFAHILVQVIIPDECILQFSGIKVDHASRVSIGGNVSKPKLDEQGQVEIDTQIRHDGGVSPYSCHLETSTVSLDSMVKDYIGDAINTDQFVEPVDLSPVFAQVTAWKKIIDDAQPLVDAAEQERAAKYTEQERQETLKQNREGLERDRKAEEKRQTETRRDTCRKAWIEKYGSDMLKVANNRGYDCKSRFLKEWGHAMLGVDYFLDFKGVITTQKRTCPSDAALAEILRLETLDWSEIGIGISFQVVWLPHGVDVEYSDEPREAVEVVLNEPYFERNYYFYQLF